MKTMKKTIYILFCILTLLMGCTAPHPPATRPVQGKDDMTLKPVDDSNALEPTPDIPTGINLLGDANMAGAQPYMNNRAQFARLPGVDSVAEILQITVTNASGQPWGAEIKKPLAVSVEKGDVALLRFRTRCVSSSDETGEGILTIYCQKSVADWDKSLLVTLSIGPHWQEYLLPFTFIDGYAAGAADLAFGLGSINQRIEIADVSLTGYGKTLTVDDLPKTTLTYAGQEPEAPWREEARQRIERIRKGDLAVRVVDRDGQPVESARVRIEMRRHAFPFGTAVVPSRVIRADEESERYTRHLKELFNAVVTENALKWEAWSGDWGPDLSSENTLKGLQWLRDNGFYIRGHALVWPSWKNMPERLKALKEAPDDIPRIIREHITEMCEATQDTVDEWDVLNEPYDNHDMMDLFGPDIMLDWFRQARTVLPDTPLYLNDYSILAAGGRDTLHQDHFETTARFLLDNGAPITGLGFQSHFGADLTPPTRVLDLLDRYAALGLDLKITEFDVNTQDEALQADYTRDFMMTIFSHPAITGFFVWGFWEGAHWRGQAAFLRRDWTERPALKAYKQLVFDDWWTRLDGQTDGDGGYRNRAFYGDYEITVQKDDRQVTVSFTLLPEQQALTLVLD